MTIAGPGMAVYDHTAPGTEMIWLEFANTARTVSKTFKMLIRVFDNAAPTLGSPIEVEFYQNTGIHEFPIANRFNSNGPITAAELCTDAACTTPVDGMEIGTEPLGIEMNPIPVMKIFKDGGHVLSYEPTTENAGVTMNSRSNVLNQWWV